MECNRDEAIHAMIVAEQKFASKDYVSAKKFAIKAQQLCPDLENIAQMIAVLDVHLAAQTKLTSTDEKDWYGILQIEPTADNASVKKQYRKLALFLHPDKNKSVGAESAFKLIGEALQVLSDKVKRVVYDTKRGIHSNVSAQGSTNMQQSQASSHQVPSQKHKSYADGNINFNEINKVSHQYPPQTNPTTPVHAAVHLFTFWTACTSCQMRYQYYRKYENQNLLCPQCRKPFIAKDLSNVLKVNVTQAWPPHGGLSSSIPGTQSWQSGNSYFSTNYGTTGFSMASTFTNSGTAGIHGYVPNPDITVGFSSDIWHKNGSVASDVSHSGYGLGEYSGGKTEVEKDLYRKIEELQRAREIQKELAKKAKAAERAQEMLVKAMLRKEHSSFKVNKLSKKPRNISGSETDEEDERVTKVTSSENGKAFPPGCKRSASYSVSRSDEDFQDLFPGKKSRVEMDSGNVKLGGLKDIDMMNKRLADMAKNTIRMRLNLQEGKMNAGKINVIASPFNKEEKKNLVPALGQEKKDQSSTVVKKEQRNSSDKKDNLSEYCSVPDSDFHNFDEGREEKDVEVGQVWALYDEKDGMPKYYVKVREVRSRTPFKVLIGWFELRKPPEELYDLLDMGFSFTCGEFRVSSSQVMDSVNSFSHLVKWEKGSKGIVKIYPKKGEVWGIYSDWEPGQSVVKITDTPSKYHMVEVVSDCSDETGVTVAQLQKVKGFKTIFQLCHEKVLDIPFAEMQRFSHQVPAYKLEGDEAPGIPKGCWELDPAAVPFNLIDQDPARFN